MRVFFRASRLLYQGLVKPWGSRWTQRSGGTADQIASFYDNLSAIYSGTMLSDHERYIFRKYLPQPPARVLDIGCGAGRTTSFLAEEGYDVVGIDLSHVLIKSAQSRFPSINFRVMDAGDLLFENDSFDAAIFSFNGLDCVAPVGTRLQILKEVLRVVKPGGRFYLSSHNIWEKFRPKTENIRSALLWAFELFTILTRQLVRPRFWNDYWWNYDSDGWILVFSGSPGKNLSSFGKIGWEKIAVCGRTMIGGRCLGEEGTLKRDDETYRLRWLTWNEHHIQYILEKQAPSKICKDTAYESSPGQAS